jgi:glycerophosphoryl diester phosphodiesterase
MASLWPFLDPAPPYGMAHRGGQGAAPENTLAAFRHAVDLGFRHLETDVHRSADGVLVAFHDDRLDRVAGRPGRISDANWDELAAIDLGGGHRIPRLVDLLDAFPDACFNIDPKADDAVDPLIDVIRSRDLIDRVCIGSFSDGRIARVRQALGPRLCTSPGPTGVAKVLAAAAAGSRWDHGYGCVQLPPRQRGLNLSSPRLIKRLHRLGLQVHYWTINERSEMERLLDAGADVIISDALDVLAEVLEARGR